MKVRHLLLPVGILSLLAACSGGGGSSGSSALPALATNAPIPGVSASLAPGASPAASLAPGASPIASLAPGASPIASLAPGASPAASLAPGATPAASLAPGAVPTAVTPVITPPPVGGGLPTPIVTPVILSLAAGSPIGIDGGTVDPREIGTQSVFPGDQAVNTAPAPIAGASFSQIDVGVDASGNRQSIPAEYNINEGGRHIHTHITLINASGQRIIFPQGVGMIGDPAAPLRTYQSYPLQQFTAGGTTGTYFLHTHDHTGFVHAEDDPTLDTQYGIHPPAQYTLGHVLKIMGETADAHHFTKYLAGPIHVYISRVYVINPSGPQDASNEIQTAPVEWKGDPFAVPAIAPDDFGKIPLESLEEITVEIGDTYHPVPRYYFPWYWCQGNPANGQTDCTLDTLPAGVPAASIMQRMPSSIAPRI